MTAQHRSGRIRPLRRAAGTIAAARTRNGPGADPGSSPPGRLHDLSEIALTHGADAITTRIGQLHAVGNHEAAECIDREWSCRDSASPEAEYTRQARILATDLYDDPADRVVARALLALLARRFGETGPASGPAPGLSRARCS